MMPPEPRQEPQDTSGAVAVDFAHLDCTTCRWPLWDGWALVPFSEQYYCGAATVGGGQPYCDEHCRVAYARARGLG